ncbi:hypothetical protein HDU92_001871 [Lobulomyces angularis]|nr:hypothetical protein HDU92_001871 [Lobulomyces angularis]
MKPRLVTQISSAHVISTLTIHNDLLFTGGIDGSIDSFDLLVGRFAHFEPVLFAMQAHSSSITSLVASNGVLFSASEDSLIKCWNVNTGNLISVIESHIGAVQVLNICPRGFLISGGEDKNIHVFDIKTGKRQMLFEGHTDTIMALASTDTLSFSAGYDNTIKIFSLETAENLYTLSSHTDCIFTLYVTEKYLFSGSSDGTIKVYDYLNGGEMLYDLVGHGGHTVVSLFYSNDNVLYSAGDDKSIVQWSTDLEDGVPVHSLLGHKDLISSLCANQGLLYSAESDFIYVWDIDATNDALSFDSPSLLENLSIDIPSFNSKLSDVSNKILDPADEIRALKEQLSRAQELLEKQDKHKLKLRSEVSSLRTELSMVKSDLAISISKHERLPVLIEELNSTKDLLNQYKSELQSCQSAHAIAVSGFLQNFDTQWMAIESDLASTQRWLNEMDTIAKFNHDLANYMPLNPRKSKDLWERDSDWDSDIEEEIQSKNNWWRSNDTSSLSNANSTEPTFIPSSEQPLRINTEEFVVTKGDILNLSSATVELAPLNVTEHPLSNIPSEELLHGDDDNTNLDSGTESSGSISRDLDIFDSDLPVPYLVPFPNADEEDSGEPITPVEEAVENHSIQLDLSAKPLVAAQLLSQKNLQPKRKTIKVPSNMVYTTSLNQHVTNKAMGWLQPFKSFVNTLVGDEEDQVYAYNTNHSKPRKHVETLFEGDAYHTVEQVKPIKMEINENIEWTGGVKINKRNKSVKHYNIVSENSLSNDDINYKKVPKIKSDFYDQESFDKIEFKGKARINSKTNSISSSSYLENSNIEGEWTGKAKVVFNAFLPDDSKVFTEIFNVQKQDKSSDANAIKKKHMKKYGKLRHSDSALDLNYSSSSEEEEEFQGNNSKTNKIKSDNNHNSQSQDSLIRFATAIENVLDNVIERPIDTICSFIGNKITNYSSSSRKKLRDIKVKKD